MSGFDYKNHEAPKLTDEFRKKFTVNIKGKDAIKVDGLIAFAHTKGIKSMITTVVQFPSQENNFTCIAKCRVVGYDWSPADNKIIEVEYEDFADANPQNCTSMTAASYPRMASTRAVGRALRKYTNIDMVTSEEIGESAADRNDTVPASMGQLQALKAIFAQKGISQAEAEKVLHGRFGNAVSFSSVTASQANALIEIFKGYKRQGE